MEFYFLIHDFQINSINQILAKEPWNWFLDGDAEVPFISVVCLEMHLGKVNLITHNKYKWHKVTFVCRFFKGCIVLMKKNKDYNLKCAACTVPVMRTAAEQVSDLFLSLW
jgi:hypothetical protein